MADCEQIPNMTSPSSHVTFTAVSVPLKIGKEHTLRHRGRNSEKIVNHLIKWITDSILSDYWLLHLPDTHAVNCWGEG